VSFLSSARVCCQAPKQFDFCVNCSANYPVIVLWQDNFCPRLHTRLIYCAFHRLYRLKWFSVIKSRQICSWTISCYYYTRRILMVVRISASHKTFYSTSLAPISVLPQCQPLAGGSYLHLSSTAAKTRRVLPPRTREFRSSRQHFVLIYRKHIVIER
jgi:hypothetical protein